MAFAGHKLGAGVGAGVSGNPKENLGQFPQNAEVELISDKISSLGTQTSRNRSVFFDFFRTDWHTISPSNPSWASHGIALGHTVPVGAGEALGIAETLGVAEGAQDGLGLGKLLGCVDGTLLEVGLIDGPPETPLLGTFDGSSVFSSQVEMNVGVSEGAELTGAEGKEGVGTVGSPGVGTLGADGICIEGLITGLITEGADGKEGVGSPPVEGADGEAIEGMLG